MLLHSPGGSGSQRVLRHQHRSTEPAQASRHALGSTWRLGELLQKPRHCLELAQTPGVVEAGRDPEVSWGLACWGQSSPQTSAALQDRQCHRTPLPPLGAPGVGAPATPAASVTGPPRPAKAAVCMHNIVSPGLHIPWVQGCTGAGLELITTTRSEPSLRF